MAIDGVDEFTYLGAKECKKDVAWKTLRIYYPKQEVRSSQWRTWSLKGKKIETL